MYIISSTIWYIWPCWIADVSVPNRTTLIASTSGRKPRRRSRRLYQPLLVLLNPISRVIKWCITLWWNIASGFIWCFIYMLLIFMKHHMKHPRADNMIHLSESYIFAVCVKFFFWLAHFEDLEKTCRNRRNCRYAHAWTALFFFAQPVSLDRPG